ncbi:MAG: class I SAM-dependent methyltransferase [Gammaproteobacteria bacterium]|nr:class I SAM-dependent methyltransferase [Gammaproteobacteria bacterium]
MTGDTVSPYHRGFREFSEAYEAFSFNDIHRDAIAFLPAVRGTVLDVGAGSGRDAAWFAARDWDVVAIEPAAALRGEAARRHPSPRIRWIDDRLPVLAAIHRLGLVFDLIWLSGVWMHVPPADRSRAMRKLATLLKPGGRIVLTLRHGPSPEDRPMWPVDAHEVERLGLDLGLALRVATERTADLQGQPGVRWQTVVLDLPDDGGGALPLLRSVILTQEKSATYKLALLRCIARIADTSPNVAREAEDYVELPLGLIALYWIRMFKPLIERGLPQRPGATMGFVTSAFRALGGVAPCDLRIGQAFAAADGEALRRALSHAARLIADMPATHLTFADNRPVFPTCYGRTPAASRSFAVEEGMLWLYGATRVPLPVWQALRRMAAWVEPMLVAEWVRLTKVYAERSRQAVTADDVLAALRWIEPERDTTFVRDLARRRMVGGQAIRCVWSGRALTIGSFDIDHCLPWSAWPCGDLWNLLPAVPKVNRHAKRERIVAGSALAQAKPLIIDWWRTAYLEAEAGVRARFAQEAQTTLPILKNRNLDLDDLFQALDFRRLRLRQDTQMAEWAGMPSSRNPEK